MALSTPTFPNPYSSTPLTNAYAWLAFLALDLSAGQGRVAFNVHPSEADWSKPPMGQLSITLGQDLNPPAVGGPPPPPAVFPTLAELMADPEFAAAYDVIGRKLYEHAAAKVPAFAGSTQV